MCTTTYLLLQYFLSLVRFVTVGIRPYGWDRTFCDTSTLCYQCLTDWCGAFICYNDVNKVVFKLYVTPLFYYRHT